VGRSEIDQSALRADFDREQLDERSPVGQVRWRKTPPCTGPERQDRNQPATLPEGEMDASLARENLKSVELSNNSLS
jgi:hypothetical protein